MTVLLNLACEYVSAAPGTGTTIQLGGGVGNAGQLTWHDAGAVNGTTYAYKIVDGYNFELCTGVYSASGNSLSRTTVIASVNGVKQTTPINASATAIICSTATANEIYTQTMSLADRATDQAMARTSASFISRGFVNRFRNGTFDIWQRGTANIVVPTAGAYVSDGWIVVPTGASCNAGHGAWGTLTSNAMYVSGATGVTDVIVKQRIESILSAALTWQRIAVTLWVANNTGATITPTLTVKHANAVDNWSASTVDVNAVAMQSIPNGGNAQIGYAWTDPGTALNGLEISFDFGNNFASGAQSIDITACDIRVVTADIAVGQVTPPTNFQSAWPPELRPLDYELRLCQRYYQSTYGVAPSSAPPISGNTSGLVPAGITDSTGAPAASLIVFPVPMRASPTLTQYGTTATANDFAYYSSGWGLATSGGSPASISPTGFIPTVGAPGANGAALAVNYIASAEL